MDHRRHGVPRREKHRGIPPFIRHQSSSRFILQTAKQQEENMKLAILILTLASAAAAQSKSPISDALRQMLGGREKNTVAAFEEMPADKYDYKPTAEQM